MKKYFAIGVGLFSALAASMMMRSSHPAAQEPSEARSVDFEFFKTHVEPIFLKKRPGHARCYVCHSGSGDGGAPPYLEKLSPGSTSWDEEQSRRIFRRVSRLVVAGDPSQSRLVMHPLAPEAGGDYSNRVHGGGRQFESQNDPDWKIIDEWVRGEKEGAPSPQ